MFYTNFTLAKIKFSIKSTSKGIESLDMNRNEPPPSGYKKLNPNAPEFFGLYGQLKEYFAGTRKQFDVPLDITVGTDFQKKVWKSLQKIPFGKMISYKQLAVKTGRPNAYRAAGSANGKNPLAVIIPCHRVINADGSIGGFSCGVEIKYILLELEKKYSAK